jgi:GNAT superfamily N-acetyltransferase
MKIERVDPADVDVATAAEVAAVTMAELALDVPNAIPPSAESMLFQARYGFDDSPVDSLWLARTDDGALVGHGSLVVSHWDNPQLALVFCGVAPQARGNGVGTALLGAQLDRACELGRSSLLTFTAVDGHAAGFLASNGFEVGMHTAQRRLHPQRIDYERIAALAAEAGEKASDYELVHLDGPASEEMLPSLISLHEAINDAPMDDISLEPDVYPVERVRRYDGAMQKRRQRVYRLMARHRRTSEWAGHTILCVDGTRPGYAVQEDTSVVRDHRGHRLGMWLKASMLLWMREEHPELTAIDTWNAVSNTHMIAVNEALGCEVSQLGVAMQRTL